MDGLLQQQLWYGVYNLNPPPLRQHTDTYAISLLLLFEPALLHSISLCAPRAGSTLEAFPPSLPLCRRRILFDHSCLSGMSEWVGATEEGDKEDNGDDKEKERKRTGT